MKKIAFITGCSAGFGEAIAQTLARAGFNVIISARRVEKLNALAKTIKQQSSVDVFVLPLDVTDRVAVKQQLHALPEAWRAIDVLVNNAGLSLDLVPIVEGDEADWEAMMNTNVLGLLYVTRQVVPQMIARKTGHIINISSISGRDVYANGTVYCASKHAVHVISKGLRLELLGKGVKVTTIGPGAADTEFSTVRFKGDKVKADQVYAGMTPLCAQDIADTVLYCVNQPAHVVVSELELMPLQQAGVRDMCRDL
jgi:3-hydroxy acid dehydrogenase / malonic semialdehyde reductase